MNRQKFDGLKWTRKACSWDEVGADDRALALAEGLPVYPAGESPVAWFSGRPAAANAIGASRPQFFVAQTAAGDLFLVNTEGYEYARYAVRIKGLRIASTVSNMPANEAPPAERSDRDRAKRIFKAIQKAVLDSQGGGNDWPWDQAVPKRELLAIIERELKA